MKPLNYFNSQQVRVKERVGLRNGDSGEKGQ